MLNLVLDFPFVRKKIIKKAAIAFISTKTIVIDLLFLPLLPIYLDFLCCIFVMQYLVSVIALQRSLCEMESSLFCFVMRLMSRSSLCLAPLPCGAVRLFKTVKCLDFGQ